MINVKLTFANGKTFTFSEPNMATAEDKVIALMDAAPGQIREVDYTGKEEHA